MARINAELLAKIETKLGIGRSRIYALISRTAAEHMLERHLAALIFAASQGISIQKFATPRDLAEIRASRSGNGSERNALAPAVIPATSKPANNKRIKGKPARKKTKGDSVFVVHGRNEKLRKSLFDFLRALDLKPLEWSKALAAAKGANPYIGEVLDAAMRKVHAVVVLFSPDDEACLKEEFCSAGEKRSEGKLQGQPRPNVIFEAGLALGRHPEKTLLIQVGKLRGFTDIAGKHVIRLSNSFDSRNDVANRLRRLGCEVDTQGTDWTNAGDFKI